MCVACIAEWEAARRAREEGGEDAVALRLRRADDDKRRKMAEFDDKARASRALADEMGAREAALRERQANAELAREQALQQLYDMNRAKAAAYNQGMRAVYTQYIIIIIIIVFFTIPELNTKYRNLTVLMKVWKATREAAAHWTGRLC